MCFDKITVLSVDKGSPLHQLQIGKLFANVLAEWFSRHPSKQNYLLAMHY